MNAALGTCGVCPACSLSADCNSRIAVCRPSSRGGCGVRPSVSASCRVNARFHLFGGHL